MTAETRKLIVGMGQLLVEGGEPQRNLERAGVMVKNAARQECDIVLLPECMDLAWTHPSAQKEALSIPGPYSQQLCQYAKESNIYLCGGLTENDNGKVYNSAIFVNPSGEIILKYRKINILVVEQEFYQLGHTLSVIETPLGTIGVNICADNYMSGLPIGHTLARMGAQVVLSPSSWTVDYSLTEENDPYGEKWIKPYSILAKLYNLVIVGTTSVGYLVGGPYEGKKMVGCSLAVGPEGIIKGGGFNEFAGELIVAEFTVPIHREKGTAIGDMLLQKGYRFS